MKKTKEEMLVEMQEMLTGMKDHLEHAKAMIETFEVCLDFLLKSEGVIDDEGDDEPKPKNTKNKKSLVN